MAPEQLVWHPDADVEGNAIDFFILVPKRGPLEINAQDAQVKDEICVMKQPSDSRFP